MPAKTVSKGHQRKRKLQYPQPTLGLLAKAALSNTERKDSVQNLLLVNCPNYTCKLQTGDT